MTKKKKKAVKPEAQQSKPQEPALQDPGENDKDKREREIRLTEVYHGCHALFSGNCVKFSERSQIRDTLIANQSSLHGLFLKYGEIKLIESVQTLIDNCAFELSFCAEMLLPGLCQTTLGQDSQKEAPQADAAGAATDLLCEMSQPEAEKPSLSPPPLETPKSLPPSLPPSPPLDTSPSSIEEPSVSPQDDATVAEIQSESNDIDKAAQKLLEDCCFDFASEWFPDALREQGWECSSAVELTKWVNIFEAAIVNLSPQVISATNIGQVLASTHKLRHTAVHRLPVTARGVNQLLRAGKTLAETLRDFTRASQLGDLIREVDENIKTMELTKNVLENRAAAQLEEIRRQREALDRQEEESIENMLREDREHKALVGSLLETAVNDILEGNNASDRTSEEDETDAQDVYFEVEEENMKVGTESLNNADDDPVLGEEEE
ncbi:hypothetical protein CSAL01_03583 [Colletotrichum salicis]|uniref:Ubiquinol-cytochrome-c reductase cytochrome c1 n=1 Tax=Colletotrichum salicis TaxID=1209931 RepID=A0A135V4W0_9PEZI|nr:hypothetical protein CSAL01_03583 [Colletotrichum salicis]